MSAPSALALLKAVIVSGRMKGVSPRSTSVSPPLPSSSGAAIVTACAVPRCSDCSTILILSSIFNASLLTESPLRPTTRTRSPSSAFADASTCARIGAPAISCSTLGPSDSIRAPSPAARTIRWVGICSFLFRCDLLAARAKARKAGAINLCCRKLHLRRGLAEGGTHEVRDFRSGWNAG